MKAGCVFQLLNDNNNMISGNYIPRNQNQRHIRIKINSWSFSELINIPVVIGWIDMPNSYDG